MPCSSRENTKKRHSYEEIIFSILKFFEKSCLEYEPNEKI